MRQTPRIGDKVKDRVSGLEGIVVARTEHLNMCDRYTVQPQVKPGKATDLPKPWSIDIADIVVLEENAIGLSPEELARHSTPPPSQPPVELAATGTGGPADEAEGHATALETTNEMVASRDW